jgi:hypothetical protein
MDVDDFDSSSPFASRGVCFQKLSDESSELMRDPFFRDSNLFSDPHPTADQEATPHRKR